MIENNKANANVNLKALRKHDCKVKIKLKIVAQCFEKIFIILPFYDFLIRKIFASLRLSMFLYT